MDHYQAFELLGGASLSKPCTMLEIYPLLELLAHEILYQLGLV